jgi:hypothetical protein
MTSLAEWRQIERERDEYKAQVERVRALLDCWRGSLDLLAMSDDKSRAPQRMVGQLDAALDPGSRTAPDDEETP